MIVLKILHGKNKMVLEFLVSFNGHHNKSMKFFLKNLTEKKTETTFFFLLKDRCQFGFFCDIKAFVKKYSFD